MLVVDFLHEFKLGVWKATFTYLIRISSICSRWRSCCQVKWTVYRFECDVYSHSIQRFRPVPTFGRDTIRKFHNDASAMKKLAARDFKDLLLVFNFQVRLEIKYRTDLRIVPFLSLRAFYLSHSTLMYKISYLIWLFGSAMPNFGSTLTRH